VQGVRQRVVGVTSQGSNRRSQQRSGSGRVSNESVRQEQEQGPIEKHTPRPRLQVWPSLKYTCDQPQVFWLTAGLSL
ncbi:unnamed protein product, partial [Staurois parvus]